MMRSSRTTNSSLTVEFALVNENILIQKERITQLYVIQSEQDPYLWFGVLFVDSGLYMGSVIRFNMIIDEFYPDCPCPKIIFDPVPYHPLVNLQTGELDTKNAFPDWNSNTHKLHQLLIFVKRVICQADVYLKQIQEVISQYFHGEQKTVRSEYINNEDRPTNMVQHQANSSTNDTPDPHMQSTNGIAIASDYENLSNFFSYVDHTVECIKLFENNHDEFQQLVNQFREKCCHELFERPTKTCGDDKNMLIFTPWNPDIHEPLRKYILAGRFAPSDLFASYHKETDSVTFVPGSGQT